MENAITIIDDGTPESAAQESTTFLSQSKDAARLVYLISPSYYTDYVCFIFMFY